MTGQLIAGINLAIAIYQPQDVRPILQAYEGKNIPIEYAKKEAEGKKQFLEQWRKTNQKAGSFTLSSLFGGGDAVRYISKYSKWSLIFSSFDSC